MQAEFDKGIQSILAEELKKHFAFNISLENPRESPLYASLLATIRDTLDSTTTMDAVPRMEAVGQACTTPLVNFFLSGADSQVSASSVPATPATEAAAAHLTIAGAAEKEKTNASTASSRSTTPPISPTSAFAPMSLLLGGSSSLATAAAALSAFSALPSFRHSLSSRMSALLEKLRLDYLTPAESAKGTTGMGNTPARVPAASLLSPHTRQVYMYVRQELGVRMHGWENVNAFDAGAISGASKMSGELGFSEADGSIGMNASRIYESIRDGKMQKVVMDIFGAGAKSVPAEEVA